METGTCANPWSIFGISDVPHLLSLSGTGHCLHFPVSLVLQWQWDCAQRELCILRQFISQCGEQEETWKNPLFISTAFIKNVQGGSKIYLRGINEENKGGQQPFGRKTAIVEQAGSAAESLLCIDPYWWNLCRITTHAGTRWRICNCLEGCRHTKEWWLIAWETSVITQSYAANTVPSTTFCNTADVQYWTHCAFHCVWSRDCMAFQNVRKKHTGFRSLSFCICPSLHRAQFFRCWSKWRSRGLINWQRCCNTLCTAPDLKAKRSNPATVWSSFVYWFTQKDPELLKVSNSL